MPLGQSAARQATFTSTYRIVGATHTSSSRKNDPPSYSGRSTASWKLAPPTATAPNVLSATSTGALTTGLATVNVRGVFTAEARSNNGDRCMLTAPTGSKKFPASAPGPFSLAVAPDPRNPSRVLVAHAGGLNVHASLSNPYFGSRCSTSVSGEPGDERMTKYQKSVHAEEDRDQVRGRHE